MTRPAPSTIEPLPDDFEEDEEEGPAYAPPPGGEEPEWPDVDDDVPPRTPI